MNRQEKKNSTHRNKTHRALDCGFIQYKLKTTMPTMLNKTENVSGSAVNYKKKHNRWDKF